MPEYTGSALEFVSLGRVPATASVLATAGALGTAVAGRGLITAQPGSCLAGIPPDIFDLVAYPGGPPGDVDLYINENMVPGCFATGLPASQAAVIAATQRPLAASAATEPSGPPAWTSVPSWAVSGTGDRVIPPAELTFMAQRAGAHITYVKAGPLSLISKAPVVTRGILEAVQATG